MAVWIPPSESGASDALPEPASPSPSALQIPVKMMPGIFMYSPFLLLPSPEACAGVGGGGKAGSGPIAVEAGGDSSRLWERDLGCFLRMMVGFGNYRAEILQQQGPGNGGRKGSQKQLEKMVV